VQKPEQFEVVSPEEMVILLSSDFPFVILVLPKVPVNAEIDGLVVLSVVSYFSMLVDVSLFMRWLARGRSG